MDEVKYENYINVSDFKEKKKKGLNGIVKPNCLMHNCIISNGNKHLNFSIADNFSHGGMAEWSIHFVDTEGHSGFMGSIPISDVTDFYLGKFTEAYEGFNSEEINGIRMSLND